MVPVKLSVTLPQRCDECLLPQAVIHSDIDAKVMVALSRERICYFVNHQTIFHLTYISKLSNICCYIEYKTMYWNQILLKDIGSEF